MGQLRKHYCMMTSNGVLTHKPTVSHHGGAWESLIRLIRKVLTSILHQQTLTDEVLVTVLCEAETILNDRPINKVSEDPNDLEQLTPNHLLTLRRKTVVVQNVQKKVVTNTIHLRFIL